MSKPVAIVTGSSGLIGSESCRQFHDLGFHIVGIDNDMRAQFFGVEASTQRVREHLELSLSAYEHVDADIRDRARMDALFESLGRRVEVVIHTAAQPSHDWAARDPHTDFGVNALGTLNLLEACRLHAPEASFIFTSTNKVYGDAPNELPLVEHATRWEPEAGHAYAEHGIDESMSIDQCKHSLFGASKVAADVLVQEYGRYFDMKTSTLRGGCLTGPDHAGAELHGFLAYLMKCTVTGRPYTVFGYEGKQVRDNIHAYDLVRCFVHIHRDPKPGAVYNIGGSRHSNCSMLEAIALCEEISGKKLEWTYDAQNRSGDHMWWISDVRRFQEDYPDWSYEHDLPGMLEEMHAAASASAARGA